VLCCNYRGGNLPNCTREILHRVPHS
jgi:hypothetical protein